jgi:HlyD family secretion protein
MSHSPTATTISGTHEPLPAGTRSLPIYTTLRRFVPWLLVLLVAAGAWLWWRHSSPSAAAAPTFRTARVQRGDVIQTVSATGPLSAVSTVEVGSQVSGNIAKLYF